MRAYRVANLEKINAKQRAYYAKNKDKINARKRAWREANPDKISAENHTRYNLDIETSRARSARYKEEHKAEIRERRRLRYYDPEVQAKERRRREIPTERFKDILKSVRCRAHERKLAFSTQAVKTVMATVPLNCKCCGCLLDYSLGHGRNPSRSRGPSIDRVDNLQGYVENNVEIICMRCNTLKGDASTEEIASVLKYMTSHKSP
jgi:hypothetical protein